MSVGKLVANSHENHENIKFVVFEELFTLFNLSECENSIRKMELISVFSCKILMKICVYAENVCNLWCNSFSEQGNEC